ncbi:MAG: glycosyltransferase [Sporocytophaga sp.]|uniref:glycosyltransferase n=1 Tax=Sporocytophaga sp. TaxID=2231183 RepID=UPI001B2A7460|nr:glycosyltransferase [Sporocytophaga sp.]MBO9700885.1 glycosyltransferase [Sporocytophaga sp.]
MARIIFTVTNDLSYDQRMQRISSTLAKAGHSVLLVGRKRKKSIELKHQLFEQKRLDCFFENGKLFYLEYNFRLLLFLIFSKADIICAIDLDTILPCYVVSKLKNKPLVYDAHELFTEVIEVVRRPFVRSMWLKLESYIVPRVKYSYTVSEGVKRIFEERYPGVNFSLIRNLPLYMPVDPDTSKEKYIVYAGAVNEGRGIEQMLNAMPEINCSLYICGDGEMFESLKAKAKDMNLDGKVKFLGYVEPEKLKEIIRKAYAGVLLLENRGASYYYSLANKFFDYMMAGIPQVTINFPEYKHLNDVYSFALLIDLKHEEIVKAFNRLLNEPALYDEIKENAMKARKVFNWEKESEALIDFYKKVESGK